MTAFVAKYDSAGRLLWLTYLGGNQQTMGIGVAVLPNEAGVAVSGVTSSDASGPFPTKNAFQDHNNGGSDYFVTVFDATGHLLYSTYLGGSGDDGSGFTDDNSNGNNLAADAHGLIYLAGTTSIPPEPLRKFPVTANALQPYLNGPSDAFLCILDPSKSGADSLIYCSFLGGGRNEKGHSVTVNAAGDLITVAGYTDSFDFPTTRNGYRSHPAPSGFTSNGFVAQFHSSAPGDPAAEYEARYATYLGADSSEARDDLYGMALGPGGVIVVTGRTGSPDFPMTGPGTPAFTTRRLSQATQVRRRSLPGENRSVPGRQSVPGLLHFSGGWRQGREVGFVLHQRGRGFERCRIRRRGSQFSGRGVRTISISCYGSYGLSLHQQRVHPRSAREWRRGIRADQPERRLVRLFHVPRRQGC